MPLKQIIKLQKYAREKGYVMSVSKQTSKNHTVIVKVTAIKKLPLQ